MKINMPFLDYCKESSDCYYIYNRGSIIYGLNPKEFFEYTVIVSDKFVIPEEYELTEGYIIEDLVKYQIISLKEWFDKMINGDIMCWECACLNKKFVIKEHVKLIMKLETLKIRKCVDALISNVSGKIALNEPVSYLDLWHVIKSCKFANQIIENHKIVNFKEANIEYAGLSSECDNSVIIEKYISDLALPYQLLRDKTDNVLKQSKIKKILQNE